MDSEKTFVEKEIINCFEKHKGNYGRIRIKKALEETKSVAGRFEIVNKEPLVIVDYAHTPDGLENVLKAAREITPKTSNLILSPAAKTSLVEHPCFGLTIKT